MELLNDPLQQDDLKSSDDEDSKDSPLDVTQKQVPNLSSHFTMEVIDHWCTFGADIDRETNRVNYIQPKVSGWGSVKDRNFRTYVPSEMTQNQEEMTMNQQLLVKIKTDVKLNLILDDGKAMIADRDSKETHFVLFESVTQRYTIGWGIFRQLWDRMRARDLVFENWVIVDFDNCLNGNKHTAEDYDFDAQIEKKEEEG